MKPVRPHLPTVSTTSWPTNEIDHFVLARLEAEGLAPADPADRYMLIRRLSLDLRGIPPTWQEVAGFVDDESPDAYGRLVQRFLHDPRYGERWARVWLDLARYADSRGYGSDPLRTNMWRYRDWVIAAMNRNLPYDQFTIHQLAGDLLDIPTLKQQMATAFHRNTMTNTEGGTDDEEFRVAAVKDRIETTMQVWMGLTMQCANCHDHKYDPITQSDYYSLFAIFNQTADSDLPDEAPTIDAPTPWLIHHLQELDDQIATVASQIEEARARLAQEREQSPPKSESGQIVRIEIPGETKILSLAEVQIFRGQDNVALKGKASQSSTDYDGAAHLAIDDNTSGHFEEAKSTTHTQQEDNPWWEVDLGETQPLDRIVIWNRTDGDYQSRLAGFRLTVMDADRDTIWEGQINKHPDPSREIAPREPTPVEAHIQDLQEQIAAIEELRPEVPTLPVMQELPEDQRRETYLMLKGDFLSPGAQVRPNLPARFRLTDGLPMNRLGAAQWLTHEENPLTARVAVNRLWANLFGVALVETEEDFGTQGTPPSHPLLLDWLATEFIRCDWDMKRLLQVIVTSSTYRQSSRMTPELIARDPHNRLLARGPRFRMEAEMVRDQAMAMSGLLSDTLFGPSVYPYQPRGMWRAAFNGQRTWPVSEGADRYRRGLYTFWRRTVPYPSMQTFDAPSRELCTIRRIRTNTPLQALVMLNDPVYVEAAQALARRIVLEGGATAGQRADFALRLCLSRPALSEQVAHLVTLYQSEREHFRNNLEAAHELATEPLGPVPDGMDDAELAAWTVVANVLLNLDGVLNKG